MRGRRPLEGRRVRAPEFCERRGGALLSDADGPAHRTHGRLPVREFESTLADRGEHLQHDADRRLQGEIHRKAAAVKIVEHARQILLQTATRRFQRCTGTRTFRSASLNKVSAPRSQRDGLHLRIDRGALGEAKQLP